MKKILAVFFIAVFCSVCAPAFAQTTIFTQTLTNNDSGNNGLSFRTCIPITGDSLGQVRVTFQSGSANWVVAHAAIGVSVTAVGVGCQQTTATPVELTFSGGSGFNLGSSSNLTSDWVNLSFTGSAILVVITDITSGNEELATGVTGVTSFLNVSGSTYNQANPAGYSGSGTSGFVPGFNLVQTQAAAGGTIHNLLLLGVGQ